MGRSAMETGKIRWIMLPCGIAQWNFMLWPRMQRRSGKYFDKSDLHQDDYNILKASSAIPFACTPYEIQGNLYFDGALGDPVPLKSIPVGM